MCVEYQLGKSTVLKTKSNKNTQKVESANRRKKCSLPKNITFKRNFHGRVHSTVHNCNYGHGESLVKLSQSIGCPISACSSVAQHLKSKQDIYISQIKCIKQVQYIREKNVRKGHFFTNSMRNIKKKRIIRKGN